MLQGALRQNPARDPGALWGHVNALVKNGHDYLTILDHYTWDHVVIFLRKIDADDRRKRINDIYNYRVAQSTLKGFKEAVQQLEQQDRLIRLREAQAEGRPLYDVEQTEREAEVLSAQGQDFFSDWTPAEQERFRAEQSSMWAQIPEHLREKARRMSLGQWD